MLVADYYSKCVEFAKLPQDLSSGTVIKFLKDQFARYGIPEQVVSDNGPQYACKGFSDFARSYGFEHVTSSPRFPQSNGFAESQVKIVKRILKKCSMSKTDVALAVIEWRNTPIDGLGYSPAQILQGRRLRSTIPTTPNQLRAKPIMVKLTTALEGKAEKAKFHYDKTAVKNEREPLSLGEQVRVNTPGGWMPAKVTKIGPEPRSYTVVRNNQEYRRNRRDLLPSKVQTNPSVEIKSWLTINQPQ